MSDNIWYDEYKKIIDDIQLSDYIILYGKNVITSLMISMFKDLDISKKYFVFSNGEFDHDELCDTSKRFVVFTLGMRLKTRKSMKKCADEYFHNCVVYDFFAIYYVWITEIIKRDCDYLILSDTLARIREDSCVPNIDSIPLSHCNLNCAECSNGMQVRKDKKIIPLEVLGESLDVITNIKPISFCNLQGGEVFIDKRLNEIIALHSQNPRIGFITIATNGTIVPSNEELDSIKKAGAIIRISNYGVLSNVKEVIRDKSISKNIPCDYYDRAIKWVKYGELVPRHRKDEENFEISKKCFFGSKDLMLYDGSLYSCCRVLFANASGLNNECTCKNTVVLNEKTTREDLDAIINGDYLYKMCDYCDWPMVEIEPAEQI